MRVSCPPFDPLPDHPGVRDRREPGVQAARHRTRCPHEMARRQQVDRTAGDGPARTNVSQCGFVSVRSRNPEPSPHVSWSTIRGPRRDVFSPQPSIEHSPLPCSEPRALASRLRQARAVCRRLMRCERRCIRPTESGNALAARRKMAVHPCGAGTRKRARPLPVKTLAGSECHTSSTGCQSHAGRRGAEQDAGRRWRIGRRGGIIPPNADQCVDRMASCMLSPASFE